MMRRQPIATFGPALAVCLAGLFSAISAAGAEGVSTGRDAARRLALLVGVGSYSQLGPARQLDGCRNDVGLMRSLLVDRFGFRKEDVVTLVDDQAAAASIRREMDRLVERVGGLPADGPPAQVVFYFSGHGSQVRDQDEGDPDCDEEDGLDETLVPYDAREQGGEQDLRDDELYRFTEAVCRGGRARIWVVLDCCHSGTGVRGTTKIRRLNRNVAALSPSSSAARKITPKQLPSEAVLLSACRAREVEPEYREGDESYGLLTRFLAQALQQIPAVSTLSYESLRAMIVDDYAREAVVPAPCPQLEGTPRSLRSVVLGAESGADRKPYFRADAADRDRRSVRLAAGVFHGVTAGSLYELYERPDQIVRQPDRTQSGAPRASLAWLKIEKVDGAGATASVFQWADARHSDRVDVALPREFQHGYAVERYHQHDHAAARLRVVRAIDANTDGPPLGPTDPSVPAGIRDALASIREGDESEWLTWVEGGAPCDLVLRIDGRYAALFPATGMTTTVPGGDAVRGEAVPASLRGGWGPIDLAEPREAARQLKDYLRRIVRARNLIRLAATQAAARCAATSPEAVQHSPIEIQMLGVELNRDLEITATRPWPLDAEQSLLMRKDDLFALRVSNASTTGKPLYVTVLAIDPDMEIQAVLPRQGGLGLEEEQRLAPGEARITSPYQCTEPYGSHHAIVLATAEPNDFCMLAQPALPRTRSAASESPLEELLHEHMYFRTRGRRPQPQKSADPTWSAAILRWEAVP